MQTFRKSGEGSSNGRKMPIIMVQFSNYFSVVLTCWSSSISPSPCMSSSGLILSRSLLGVLAGVMPVAGLPLSAVADLGVAAAAGTNSPPGVMPPEHATDQLSYR